MSTPREIPGFYYDQVRNRYFRIQDDHRVPNGIAHSRSAIKAQQEATALEQTRTEREDRERKGRIRRKNPNNFSSLSLALKIGKHPREILAKLAQNYVSRFHKSTAVSLEGRKLEGFTVTPNGQLYTMLTAPNGVSPFTIKHSTSIQASSGTTPPLQYVGNAWTSMTSIANRYLLCTYGELFTYEAYILPLTFLGPTLVCLPLEGNDTDEMSIHNRYQELMITDLATPPDTTSLNLALATDNGLYIGELPLLRPSPHLCPTLRKEQIVVTFKDTNVVMSGERSGAINFTDVRVPSTVHRMHHSSGPNGIVLGRNTNQIIVSGLGTIALYDLRYTKAVNQKKRRRTNEKFTSSKPLIPFYVPRSHKSNRYTPGKNLAYSRNLDIAVVACQGTAPNAGHTGGVLLYDASTGQLLDSPISGYGLESMRGVAIARVRDGPESIFVGEERRLHEYRVDYLTAGTTGGGESAFQGVENGVKKRSFDLRDLGRERFPLDAKLGAAENWIRGDMGPAGA